MRADAKASLLLSTARRWTVFPTRHTGAYNISSIVSLLNLIQPSPAPSPRDGADHQSRTIRPRPNIRLFVRLVAQHLDSARSKSVDVKLIRAAFHPQGTS